ncbi:MAG: CDP-diacylglycerol--glycerol-3-phosphate 3-phosphatidyltransferase [Lentisphaeria bacterium]|nr:CDP-diacylglycerol--glycerol-3-phosphate 3-phosphatidyltransferase [Lentisphaeria bacterium]NQZ71214.1 CDP-diacylglycerol--glycerol-3-phosphate 3-phosphatidyltransferase [Lentisphaeria bacterium]
MNLPNKITVSRLGFTFIFMGLAAVSDKNPDHLIYWRVGYVLAIIAGMTDYIDGYLARKYDLVTDFGKLMDPLADKIFTVGCFVVLTSYDIVPAWVTILILAREFAVTGMRTLAAKSGEVIAAKDIGKYKTAFQMLVLALGGCFWVEWLEKTNDLYRIGWPIALYGTVAITIYSGWDYLWGSRKLYMSDC